MKKREQVKILLESGFKLKRIGTKHDIYWNGIETIAISRGNGSTAPCTIRSLKSKTRKAREERGV